uniref:Nitrogenase molybdenum-iron protein, alpha and beta chains n=1 Tax=Eubacterium cellulosolvens (strain ATCC 43171 / JCM 9499 / 6) TaxID=633697 RepID=I5AWQ3_EUBC6
MSSVIKNPRNGCALHGALQTVQEIEGVVPVVHANAGCGVINYLANRTIGNGNGRYSGYNVPGTAAQERHVIFGGASRLREQIKNTIKVVKGELYVILNSCESAMVGDDVDAMTREIVEQGEPVVDTLIAGFNGGSHYGYEHVLTDILKSIDGVKRSERETDSKLINIFGIVPEKDPYWQGNLEEIARIFEGVGWKVNLFFGVSGGVGDLIRAKNAAVSVVFSRWGELPAKLLEEKFDIPFVLESSLPVSVRDEVDLIHRVAEYVPVDPALRESFLQREAAYQQYYTLRIRDDIFEYDLGRRTVIVGDEEQVIRYGKIFKEVLGARVVAAVLTDALKKDEEHETDNTELLASIAETVHITSDEKDIEDIIRQSRAEVVVGSTLEANIAKKRNLSLLALSYPVYHHAILNQATAGVRGQIGVLQKYISTVKRNDQQKKEELLRFVRNAKGGE